MRYLGLAFLLLIFVFGKANGDEPVGNLKDQVDKLESLLDGGEFKRSYCLFSAPDGPLALVLFILEPGNRFEQYVALFGPAESEEVRKANEFSLLDYRVVGRKGWRVLSFECPEVLSLESPLKGKLKFDGRANQNGEPPNFPSKKIELIVSFEHAYFGGFVWQETIK